MTERKVQWRKWEDRWAFAVDDVVIRRAGYYATIKETADGKFAWQTHYQGMRIGGETETLEEAQEIAQREVEEYALEHGGYKDIILQDLQGDEWS